MQNRSYTSIFNLGLVSLAALLLVTPILVAERTLVPRYSSQQIQMNLVDLSLQLHKKGSILLLGDSTIRNLHGEEQVIEADADYTNAAAGGAQSKEWYFSLRNALRVSRDFKAVVVGMSNGQGMAATDRFPPYYPFLLGVRDAWDEYRAGRMDWATSARLASYIFSKILYTKDDVVYGLSTRFLPTIRQFLMEQIVDQKTKEGQFEEAPGGGPPSDEERFEGASRIKQAAMEAGIRVFFVLSPTSKNIRENVHYRGMQTTFEEACRRLKLACFDLSDKVPDHCFQPDMVHLKHEYSPLFKELVENLLKKERLL